MAMIDNGFRAIVHIQPSCAVTSFGIERLGLGYRIEDAKVGGGVGAAAGDPLPRRGVVGRIGVEEAVPEPLFATPPVDQKVLGEEGGADHADAVVHIAGPPELPHAGIDKVVAGLAAAPGTEAAVVVMPRKGVELTAHIGSVQIGDLVEQTVGEFAPRQFRAELFGRGGKGGFMLDGLVELIKDAVRTDLAEAQVGRQVRGGVEIGPVAIIRIPLQEIFDKCLNPKSVYSSSSGDFSIRTSAFATSPTLM